MNRTDSVVTIFCYSVRDDWFRKLKQDAKVIHNHTHTCDRLTYLSTYNFTSAERDVAVKYIKYTYGWELETFGLERLRLLRSTKHGSLIPAHPQIFNPRFFESQAESSEIRHIRSLMDRLITANEKYMRTHLRLIVWPYHGDVSPETLIRKNRHVTVAIPKPEAQGTPPIGPEVVLSKAAMQDCSELDFWGTAGIRRERDGNQQESHLLFLVSGGPLADVAASELSALAAESGRLYQTLPPSLAPVPGTTSPRNLWAAVLYGWLRGTTWIPKGDGFEYVALPFAASAELWRRLPHGTTRDGRVESSIALTERAQRLLLAATSANRQTLTMNSDMHGFHLGTGDGPTVESKDAREIATYRRWVEELLDASLIEDRWHRGQVFVVIAKGYTVADDIRRMN